MKRLLGAAVATGLALSLALPARADTVWTRAEVQLRESGNALAEQGDMLPAIERWGQLVDSLRTHNYDACGLYAQKLGRALDKLGRYAEAARAFDAEIECWSKFPDRKEWTLWDERRVEQIRPEIRTFVARSVADEPARPLAKHEPAFGTMLGATVDTDTAVNNDLTKVAQTYGKPYAMVLVYAEWGQNPTPALAVQRAKEAGAALQVAWHPSQGLEAVTDSSYVRNFARQLKAYGHPVFLRFGSEMNDTGNNWNGNPALFREKFALIARIVREEAPNVAIVWSPNFVGFDPHEYYPGDEHVDWIGMSVYHEPWFSADPTSVMNADIFYQGKRSNPLDKVKPLYERYSARKPVMISESGFAWATRKPSYTYEAQWAAETMKRFYGYAPLVFPRLKAISLFNVDVNAYPRVQTSGHYVLSGDPVMTAAYKQATASDWYLSSPAAQPDTFWRPFQQATVTGKTRVASYVNLAEGVSRVDYRLDGKLLATARELPWVADLDLTGLTGPHTLEVLAYDSKGNVGHTQSYPIDGDAVKVSLNGRILDFDQPPVLLEGRTLVPARVILEALGATVSWENPTETVIAVRDGKTLRLQIGNVVPTLDGNPLPKLEVPAKVIGGRTLVPARFVAENYNMDVKWDDAAKTVIITSKP